MRLTRYSSNADAVAPRAQLLQGAVHMDAGFVLSHPFGYVDNGVVLYTDSTAAPQEILQRGFQALQGLDRNVDLEPQPVDVGLTGVDVRMMRVPIDFTFHDAARRLTAYIIAQLDFTNTTVPNSCVGYAVVYNSPQGLSVHILLVDRGGEAMSKCGQTLLSARDYRAAMQRLYAEFKKKHGWRPLPGHVALSALDMEKVILDVEKCQTIPHQGNQRY